MYIWDQGVHIIVAEMSPLWCSIEGIYCFSYYGNIHIFSIFAVCTNFLDWVCGPIVTGHRSRTVPLDWMHDNNFVLFHIDFTCVRLWKIKTMLFCHSVIKWQIIKKCSYTHPYSLWDPRLPNQCHSHVHDVLDECPLTVFRRINAPGAEAQNETLS